MTGPPLLSVILLQSPHLPASQSLFALACQDFRPFEVLLARAGGFSRALAAAHEYQALAPFEFREVAPSEAWHAATGRYVAFLRPNHLVYPGHFRRLVEALETAPERSWAVGPARWTTVRSSRGEPYCAGKKGLGCAGLPRPAFWFRLTELPICAALFRRTGKAPAIAPSSPRLDGVSLLRHALTTPASIVEGPPRGESQSATHPLTVEVRSLVRRWRPVVTTDAVP